MTVVRFAVAGKVSCASSCPVLSSFRASLDISPSPTVMSRSWLGSAQFKSRSGHEPEAASGESKNVPVHAPNQISTGHGARGHAQQSGIGGISVGDVQPIAFRCHKRRRISAKRILLRRLPDCVSLLLVPAAVAKREDGGSRDLRQARSVGPARPASFAQPDRLTGLPRRLPMIQSPQRAPVVLHDVGRSARCWGRCGILYGGLFGFVLGAVLAAFSNNTPTFGIVGTLIVASVECAAIAGAFGAFAAALRGTNTGRDRATGLDLARRSGRCAAAAVWRGGYIGSDVPRPIWPRTDSNADSATRPPL